MIFFTKHIRQIIYGLVFIVIVSLALFITTKSPDGNDSPAQGKVVFNNVEFVVLIADTPKLKALGLSYRETLPHDTGMLFVFSEPNRYGFWMKDMLVSIDIIWFDEEFVVVGVDENISPESYPEVFMPAVPVRFVLEVNAGQVSDNGITIGDKAIYVRL